MRHLEDHEVDRPAVYAQQCAQPTGTNQSIGLTSFSLDRSVAISPYPPAPTAESIFQAAPGAHISLEIPVPFPNTAVKQPEPMIVHSAKVGQRRVILPKAGHPNRVVGLRSFLGLAFGAFARLGNA